jgi:hypothetical protein
MGPSQTAWAGPHLSMPHATCLFETAGGFLASIAWFGAAGSDVRGQYQTCFKLSCACRKCSVGERGAADCG